jgi:hypothetical protein
MATSFSGGRSESTWRELPTTGKQLVNYIAVPSTHLSDDSDKQCTVDEDASSEESSKVALPQDYI